MESSRVETFSQDAFGVRLAAAQRVDFTTCVLSVLCGIMPDSFALAFFGIAPEALPWPGGRSFFCAAKTKEPKKGR